MKTSLRFVTGVVSVKLWPHPFCVIGWKEKGCTHSEVNNDCLAFYLPILSDKKVAMSLGDPAGSVD